MKTRSEFLRWFTVCATLLLLLAGCGDTATTLSGTTTPSDPPTTDPTDPPTDPPVVAEAPLAPEVLATAASMLAAASGKENPITVDHVVFVNSVLGINDVPRTQELLFGDLWVLNRDEYGVPITHTVEFDGQEFQCQEPVASEPLPDFLLLEDGTCEQQVDAEGNPLYLATDIVPMVVEAYKNGSYKCAVNPCYLDYTQEFEIGRLNMVRSSVQNPEVIARAFAEAMKNINAADKITLDLSGRLVMTTTSLVENAETGELEEVVTTAAIDSPRESLALYLALLRYGRLAGYGVETQGEAGEVIPAPWLEIDPAVQLGEHGELEYLRSGTEGRDLDHGVDLVNGYADLSSATHNTRAEYQGVRVDYVQYLGLPELVEPALVAPSACEFVDAHADLWARVLEFNEFYSTNIAGFTRHADDSRRIILFTHAIIQGLPETGVIPELPLLTQLQQHDPGMIPELLDDGGADRHLLLETAAALLGAASGKENPIGIDAVVFINTLLGLNDAEATTDKGDLFGDLWVLNRDADGAPILQSIDFADQTFQCVEPLAAEPLPALVLQEDGSCVQQLDEFGAPIYLDTNIVPMIVEEYMDGQYKCGVDPCYADYVQEFEMGRLNVVRTAITNANVLNHQLVEAMNDLNTATQIKPDLGGRLVYTVPYVDDAGEEQSVDKTIDSPLQNLALYGALLRWGKLEGEVTIKVEGKDTLVQLALNPEIELASHGMSFLRDGIADFNGLGRHQFGNATGYGDFSWFNHCSEPDYAGVPVSYVQWHEPDENGCSYTSMTDDLWTRVLGSDESCATNIAAFARQADQARQIIVFNHDIIQELP